VHMSMNFEEPAATWLQTVQRRGRIADWEKMCELVMEKFDKDQYEVLLQQFNPLKQTSSVLEYQAAFEKLAHGVVLYNLAYTTPSSSRGSWVDSVMISARP